MRPPESRLPPRTQHQRQRSPVTVAVNDGPLKGCWPPTQKICWFAIRR